MKKIAIFEAIKLMYFHWSSILSLFCSFVFGCESSLMWTCVQPIEKQVFSVLGITILYIIYSFLTLTFSNYSTPVWASMIATHFYFKVSHNNYFEGNKTNLWENHCKDLYFLKKRSRRSWEPYRCQKGLHFYLQLDCKYCDF